MANDTEERLVAIVRRILKAPNLVLTDDLSAKNVEGWDSFTHVEIILAIEAELGFRFSTLEISQLENWGDLRRRAAARLGRT